MILEFFTKHPKDWEAHQAGKPQRGIAYDPGLITALTHQHRQLVLLLVKASSAAEQCYYAESAEALGLFKEGLEMHLQREQEQLMPYLAKHLRGEDGRELVREMQSHNALVERTVKSFLDSYSRKPVSADNLGDFVVEIERV